MTWEEMTWSDLARFISAIAALVAAIASVWGVYQTRETRRRIESVHRAVDGADKKGE